MQSGDPRSISHVKINGIEFSQSNAPVIGPLDDFAVISIKDNHWLWVGLDMEYYWRRLESPRPPFYPNRIPRDTLNYPTLPQTWGKTRSQILKIFNEIIARESSYIYRNNHRTQLTAVPLGDWVEVNSRPGMDREQVLFQNVETLFDRATDAIPEKRKMKLEMQERMAKKRKMEDEASEKYQRIISNINLDGLGTIAKTDTQQTGGGKNPLEASGILEPDRYGDDRCPGQPKVLFDGVGQPQTIPVFYGPRPWLHRSCLDYVYTLPVGGNRVEDLVLYERIRTEEEFTAEKALKRAERFGKWQLRDHVTGPVRGFDEEKIFMDMYRLGHSLNVNWLDSTIEEVVWKHLIEPLATNKHCDVAVIGRSMFVDDWAKQKMSRTRMEWLLYEDPAEFQHIITDMREKRFWAFMLHNSPDIAHPKKYKIKFNYEKISGELYLEPNNDFVRLEYLFLALDIPMGTIVYYNITTEADRFRRFQYDEKMLNLYYSLSNQEELDLLCFKANLLVEDGGECNVNITKSKPMNAEKQCVPVQGSDTTPQIEDRVAGGNHYFLAIFDKKTGKFYNHDSTESRNHQKIIDSLAYNLNIYNQVWDLGARDFLISENRIPRFIQDNGNDCGYITVHNMIQFLLHRIDANERGIDNDAARMQLTPTGWKCSRLRYLIELLVGGENNTYTTDITEPEFGVKIKEFSIRKNTLVEEIYFGRQNSKLIL
jgi:hypothetical protein